MEFKLFSIKKFNGRMKWRIGMKEWSGGMKWNRIA